MCSSNIWHHTVRLSDSIDNVHPFDIIYAEVLECQFACCLSTRLAEHCCVFCCFMISTLLPRLWASHHSSPLGRSCTSLFGVRFNGKASFSDTTGSHHWRCVCVCMCVLRYYLNSNIWHHTVLLLNSIDSVFNHTPIHITDMHPFALLNLFS